MKTLNAIGLESQKAEILAQKLNILLQELCVILKIGKLKGNLQQEINLNR